jgi:hypothetical protein
MNAHRNFRLFALLALALLVASLAPTSASAQEYKGYFTLPVETRWGQMVLPPGTYSVTLDSLSFPNIAKVQGEGTHFFVMPSGVATGEAAESSKLVIARSSGRARIRSFCIGVLGTTFQYAAPKREPLVVAQGPELIERLTITLGGK